MGATLDRASRFTLDLLFPPQCALCRTQGAVLCDYCAALLPLADGTRCEICWDDCDAVTLCRHCVASPPPFASARAPYAHHAGARTLVHLLKYEGLSSLADPLASLMLASLVTHPDVVVPIPLHRSRQRSRGYNQAAMLARSLARRGGYAFDEKAARRVRPTRALAESTTREERCEIVAGAFAADATRVRGLHVLLVDDVITTGATLGACADALLEAGAASVAALTFSRA